MKNLSALISMFVSSICFAGQLSVTGECQKEVTPDRVSVTYTAKALEKDPKTASAKASAQYERLKAEIKKLNLKDSRISTSGFNVGQEWDYGNNKRSLRGYSASVSLTAETSEVARAGELLDVAAKLNIDEVGTPSTYLSPTLEQKEYESCLTVAIRHAREKASSMATAAGLSLGKLLTLNENGNSAEEPPQPMAKNRMMMEESASPKIGFDSRPSNVDVTIHAVYEVK